ncbi:hypothetical protein ACPEEZ_03145 [Frigoribacterium sp. 2-23]|uniref:hypothetical protein n=1 Tax=Frigoribacterium sp. 2-23 TaxID=3415006 RepID=UPI003C701EB7
MSDLRRPWYTLTKTGTVMQPVLEIVVGVFGLGVQVANIAAGVSFTLINYVIVLVALLLIAQGVADLVWWSRDDRRARARQAS